MKRSEAGTHLIYSRISKKIGMLFLSVLSQIFSMLNSYYYIRNHSYHFTLCFLFTLVFFLSVFQFLRINNFFGASFKIMFSIFILLVGALYLDSYL